MVIFFIKKKDYYFNDKILDENFEYIEYIFNVLNIDF